MSIDITNHLIPYTQVKRMLEQAWEEGFEAGNGLEFNINTPNPYREDT